ncbi:hypothetical protein ABT026_09510 [Streptomyces sp. NPDC002734]|uniref:hypothetical protein n=1 Tax=Streptomyces sp. NPDC002734 TaxID=3154426 RepID=UPI0033215C71
MPTPYGSRGMAFGPQELRVLRRALALALHPRPASPQEVQDCLRLADAVDEVTREAARQRAFLLADLVRYRAALPGTVTGYLRLLREALDAGHHPEREDLAALRALSGNPLAAALLRRCDAPALPAPLPAPTPLSLPVLPAQGTEPATAVRPELVPVPATATVPTGRRPAAEPAPFPGPAVQHAVPAARTRLLALPGGLSAEGDGEGDGDGADDRPEPSPSPDPQRPGQPAPGRPIPTPGEVFPRRKPSSPPSSPPQDPSQGRLAAG